MTKTMRLRFESHITAQRENEGTIKMSLSLSCTSELMLSYI